MSKQLDMNDLIPSAMKEQSRRFIDDEYTARHHDENLPMIRTRYEAYGKMSEGAVNVKAAMDGVTAGMRDCLKALTGMDNTYRNAAEVTYNALLDTFMAVAEMAVQTVNCIYQIEDIMARNVTPMEEMAAEALDDTGSENTDPVEDGELPDDEEDEENE